MIKARQCSGLICVAVAMTLPLGAQAYSGGSEVSDPCHETITLDALALLRTEHGLAPHLAPEGQDQALVDDLPISRDTDLAGATLVLANRDVDLEGNAPDSLDELAPVHGSPENQAKHCLRAPVDDEPNGSARALVACRAQIRMQVEKSLAGLAPDGSIDPSHRTTFKAVLNFRGPVEAPLPTFYVEMGRALHSLQDSFSHQWRTADHRRVTTVLNYAEVVNDEYQETRDGPPHSSQLDECQGLDAFRKERLAAATSASKELMAAALFPAANAAERMVRVDAVLSAYLELEPGCTPENAWCDAPETKYRDTPGCVCSITRAGPLWGLWPFGLGVVLLAARRLRRARAGGPRVAGAVTLMTFALLAPPAFAQDEPPPAPVDEPPAEPPAPPAEEPPAKAPDPAPADGPTKPEAVCPTGQTPIDTSPDSENRQEPFPFGVYVAGSGALMNAGTAAAIGLRYRLGARVLVGIDAEYNPWFSRTTREFRSGTTNIYGTLVVRFPMDFERFNVRSTLQLGISRMNFDLYGVPEGTVGPYVGFSLLGAEFEISRSLYLVFEPAHIAIPIPQTAGVPFAYPQYRLTLGVQFGA